MLPLEENCLPDTGFNIIVFNNIRQQLKDTILQKDELHKCYYWHIVIFFLVTTGCFHISADPRGGPFLQATPHCELPPATTLPAALPAQPGAGVTRPTEGATNPLPAHCLQVTPITLMQLVQRSEDWSHVAHAEAALASGSAVGQVWQTARGPVPHVHAMSRCCISNNRFSSIPIRFTLGNCTEPSTLRLKFTFNLTALL